MSYASFVNIQRCLKCNIITFEFVLLSNHAAQPLSGSTMHVALMLYILQRLGYSSHYWLRLQSVYAGEARVDWLSKTTLANCSDQVRCTDVLSILQLLHKYLVIASTCLLISLESRQVYRLCSCHSGPVQKVSRELGNDERRIVRRRFISSYSDASAQSFCIVSGSVPLCTFSAIRT